LNLLPLGHAGGKVIIHVPEIVKAQRREFFIAEGLGQELANISCGRLAAVGLNRSPLYAATWFRHPSFGLLPLSIQQSSQFVALVQKGRLCPVAHCPCC
jgi:hypothetical protein